MVRLFGIFFLLVTRFITNKVHNRTEKRKVKAKEMEEEFEEEKIREEKDAIKKGEAMAEEEKARALIAETLPGYWKIIYEEAYAPAVKAIHRGERIIKFVKSLEDRDYKFPQLTKEQAGMMVMGVEWGQSRQTEVLHVLFPYFTKVNEEGTEA